MASVEKAANYRSVGTILSDASPTAVYVCPIGSAADVTMINIADSGGGAVTATIEWTDSSANNGAGETFVIVWQKAGNANEALKEEYFPLHLDAGDELKVTGADGYHVAVTVMERTGRVG